MWSEGEGHTKVGEHRVGGLCPWVELEDKEAGQEAADVHVTRQPRF